MAPLFDARLLTAVLLAMAMAGTAPSAATAATEPMATGPMARAAPAAPSAAADPADPAAAAPSAAGTFSASASSATSAASAAAAPAVPGTFTAAAAAETSGAAPATRLVDQETLEAVAAGKKIGAIHIVTENIFDPKRPGERHRLFRLVNRLHRTTRPEVIQHQLLFQSGDSFSPETVRETERMLRANRYLYEATIRPVAEDAQKVDLEVLTRDVWTLQGGVNFRRAGGANSFAFDLEDENFFGTGKDLEVGRLSNVDRTTKLVRYRDPSLAGTHALLDTTLASSTDGNTRILTVARPFYALDTRWALGASALHDDRVDPLYDGGSIVDRFRQRQDLFEVYGGLSPGLLAGVTQRFRLGFTYDRNLFAGAPGFAPPNSLAANRTLAYPWIGYESVGNGFVTLSDFDRIKRKEDINLGRVITARLGWSAPAFGGDRSRLIFSGAATQGWLFGPRQLLLARASLSGRLRDGTIENGIASAGLRYFRRTFADGLFVVKLSGDMAENLDLEKQLLLGGDNGLRGYPLRYQAGDRRFLLTLEQRFFGSREYFHLFNLGAAAFFDAGRSWYVEPPPSFLPVSALMSRMLKDVGAGLRLGSSRSATGAVVHLDIAYPLDRTRSIRAVQFLVTTSETF
jgi:hypothetical protein